MPVGCVDRLDSITARMFNSVQPFMVPYSFADGAVRYPMSVAQKPANLLFLQTFVHYVIKVLACNYRLQ